MAGKGGGNVQQFVAMVDAMREATRGLTLREIIEHMLQASGLVDHYRVDKEGKDRLENLDELVNAAEAFVTQEGFGKDAVALPVDEFSQPDPAPAPAAAAELAKVLSGLGVDASPAGGISSLNTTPDADTGEIMSPLAAFLTHASLEAGDNQAQGRAGRYPADDGARRQGLEFDAVFITGLEEGLFPHENSVSDLDGLEEERRLMYVAITRARKRLYLSCSQTRMLHGQTRYNVKSRFFDELPEHALKWITPRNQAFGSGFARDYQSAWSRGSGLGSIVGAGRVEAPAPMVSSKPTPHGLRSGQGVFHTKFGEGVVVTLEGVGEDARAQVNFGRHGMKWLALSVAKLTPFLEPSPEPDRPSEA